MCMIRGVRSWLRGNCILLWLIPSSIVYCTSSCGAAPGVRGLCCGGRPPPGERGQPDSGPGQKPVQEALGAAGTATMATMRMVMAV